MLLIHNSSVMCSWPSHIKEDSENETIANAKRNPSKESSILFTWFLRTLFLDGSRPMPIIWRNQKDIEYRPFAMRGDISLRRLERKLWLKRTCLARPA